MDESGANLCFCRDYARIYGGQRIKLPKPYPRGQHYTIMSAIGLDGIKASLYGAWAANGSIFYTFIEQCLLPNLRQGDFVVLDNVSFHKVAGIEKLITSVGASLVYLPPYSPDFSPIENMWSKIKSVLKKEAARTAAEFKRAIKKAFESISLADLAGWFKHCGYNIPSL